MSVEYEKNGERVGLLAAEEPPAHSGRGGTERSRAIDSILPALREQRDTWFRIAEFPKKSSASSTAGRLRKRSKDYEWRASVVGDGSVLWGRYVGRTRR